MTQSQPAKSERPVLRPCPRCGEPGGLIYCPKCHRPKESASMAVAYHPDPEINAEVVAEALEGEKADLAVGYPPRRWQCECGASHGRGHFQMIGVHRCLGCGYVSTGGVMFGTSNPVPPNAR